MDQDTFLALAAKAVGNGKLVFGFVSAVDKGLEENEYVVTSRLPGEFAEAEKMVHSESDVVAMSYDAVRVQGFNVAHSLKPLVLAARWYTVISGCLGHESAVLEKARLDQMASLDEGGMEIMTKALEIDKSVAALPIYITTVMYFNSNHNTGGNVLPKGFTKILRTVHNLDQTVDDSQITRAVYLAGHAADKRLTLRSFEGANVGLIRPQTYGEVVKADFDSWAKVRAQLRPAGTHVVGALLVVLHKLAAMGLSGMNPVPQAMSSLSLAVGLMNKNPNLFHPGAKFLYGADPVALSNVDDLKVHLGFFGGFCEELGICKSVYSAPQYKHLAEAHSDPGWTAMGRTLNKSAEATVANAKAAMLAVGASLGQDVPDPTKQSEEYLEYHNQAMETIEALRKNW